MAGLKYYALAAAMLCSNNHQSSAAYISIHLLFLVSSVVSRGISARTFDVFSTFQMIAGGCLPTVALSHRVFPFFKILEVFPCPLPPTIKASTTDFRIWWWQHPSSGITFCDSCPCYTALEQTTPKSPWLVAVNIFSHSQSLGFLTQLSFWKWESFGEQCI